MEHQFAQSRSREEVTRQIQSTGNANQLLPRVERYLYVRTLNMCRSQISLTGLRLERKLLSLVTLAVLRLIMKSETMNY